MSRYQIQSELLLLLLLFLTFSALIGCQPEKHYFYTVANPARGLLDREKKKKKSGSAPTPPLPRAAHSEKKSMENEQADAGRDG